MRRLSRQDALGVALMALSLASLVGLAVAQAIRHAYATSTENVPGIGAAPSTVLLIDVTDAFSESQIVDLQARVQQFVRTETKEGEFLAVYALGAFEEGSLRRIFSQCVPQRRANPLFENPRLVSARYDSLFAHPLLEAVARLARCEPTATSPIMSSISLLAEELHESGVSEPHLVVVSDCLERTAQFSLYGDPVEFQAFANTALAPDRQADVRGIEVDIWLVKRARDEAYQGPALRRFWESYLRAGGAGSVHFRLL